MEKLLKIPGLSLLANRLVIALLSAASGVLLAAFPLEMAAICGGR